MKSFESATKQLLSSGKALGLVGIAWPATQVCSGVDMSTNTQDYQWLPCRNAFAFGPIKAKGILDRDSWDQDSVCL